MQGWSEYKVQCCKFKRLGDGLQSDCIVDEGYNWDFYFRNKPVPKKWIDMGFCAMHACHLHMFLNFHDNYHMCKMDNLFNPVVFFSCCSPSLSKEGKDTGSCKKEW
eukprot:1098880-Ditylum_brightwellii.AAC.1